MPHKIKWTTQTTRVQQPLQQNRDINGKSVYNTSPLSAQMRYIMPYDK